MWRLQESDKMLGCRELSGLLRHDVQLLVRQNRPKVPLTTRNLYLQARPVEVYPVIYSLLPGYANSPWDIPCHVRSCCFEEPCLCMGLRQSIPVVQQGQHPRIRQGVSSACPKALLALVFDAHIGKIYRT